MKMQNDAIRRVEDMQKRARKSAGIEEKATENQISVDEARHIPQPSGYLGKNAYSEVNKRENTYSNTSQYENKSYQNSSTGIIDKIKNGLGDLNIDSDKALLLSLIMLLSEENADELLIMALIYMLN